MCDSRLSIAQEAEEAKRTEVQSDDEIHNTENLPALPAESQEELDALDNLYKEIEEKFFGVNRRLKGSSGLL